MSEINKEWLEELPNKIWDDLAGVRRHFLHSERELLLALRAGFDLALDKIEEHECHADEQKTKE